jgi:hypothetical protein
MTENLSTDSVSNEKFTLLDSFFKEKILEYDEPQRKGTPRGEPIGFSAKKYYAALMMLKKFPLKDLAGMINVSYGLLRKWRTEDKFIEQIEKNETDFTLRVFKHLVKRGEKQKKLRDDYFNKSVEYIAATYPPLLTLNEFNDLKFYTNSLVITIARSLPKYYEKKYKKAVDRINDIYPKTDDGDRLVLAVSSQFQSFYDILKTTHGVKTKKELSGLIKEVNALTDKKIKAESKLVQSIIAAEWKITGTISELVVKNAIYTIHNLSDNYTLVDMD